MLKMFIRGITWLCPCWLVDRNRQVSPQHVQIQMMNFPYVRRVTSQQHIEQPLVKQKYYTPSSDDKSEQIEIIKRFSILENKPNANKNNRESDKMKQSDDFMSFKRSQSLIKRRFKVIKTSGDDGEGLYQSMTKIKFQNKEQYQQLIQNYNSFVQITQSKQMKFRESQLLQIERLKKRLIIQTQNQIQQFEYFTTQLNVIYQNKQLNMVVELKEGEEVFETKTYCTLCRFTCPPIAISALLRILNSTDCQNIFNSFKNIKSICKNPQVIVQVQKNNKSLLKPLTFTVLKFLSILAQEEQNKIFILQLDSSINLETFSNVTEDTYKKITRIVRGEENTLFVEIYMEESFSLHVSTSIHKYYKDIFEKFTWLFLKKLKSL